MNFTPHEKMIVVVSVLPVISDLMEDVFEHYPALLKGNLKTHALGFQRSVNNTMERIHKIDKETHPELTPVELEQFKREVADQNVILSNAFIQFLKMHLSDEVTESN